MSILQPDALSLLYEQHAQYSAELARTHQVLGKLYKKLAKVESALAEPQGAALSRCEKKKWKYTRTISKRGIANLEAEQASLHQKLEQCNNFIASYQHTTCNWPITPWTAGLPGSPYLFTPYSPVAYSPWTSHTSQPSSDDQSESQPQYWDLSMLRDRRLSSPYGSSSDSGYHEPLIHGFGHTNEPLNATDHVYVHELLQPMLDTTLAETANAEEEREDTMTSTTEEDEVPALKTPVSPAKLGAQSAAKLHKRCYSVDAAQLMSSHLRTPSIKTIVRGTSVGPTSSRKADIGSEQQEKELEGEQ